MTLLQIISTTVSEILNRQFGYLTQKKCTYAFQYINRSATPLKDPMEALRQAKSSQNH